MSLTFFIMLILGAAAIFAARSRRPSFSFSKEQFTAVAQEFPLALGGTTASFVLSAIGVVAEIRNDDYYYLVTLTSLGAIYFAALRLIFPVQEKLRTRLSLLCAALLLLFGYAVIADWSEPLGLTKLTQYVLGGFLLFFVAPHASALSSDELWARWLGIVTAFALAIFYCAAVGIACSIVLLSANYLFELHLSYEPYVLVWLALSFLLGPVMLLSRFSRLDQAATREPAPRGLAFLTTYLLIPFVAVYAVMLCLYSVQILLSWHLPKGLVAWLVCGFALLGTATWVLVWPDRLSGKTLHRIFFRWYFVLLLPLLVLLFVAIDERVSLYGVTEQRYFLSALAIWITAFALFSFFPVKERLSLLSSSLCALVLLSSAGPWGAYETSMRSQRQRISSILESAGISPRTETKVRRAIDTNKLRQICASVDYLVSMHGPQAFAGLFAGNESASRLIRKATPAWNVSRKEHTDRSREMKDRLLASIGLEYTTPYDSGYSSGHDSFYFLAVLDKPVVVDTGSWNLVAGPLQPSANPTALGASGWTIRMEQSVISLDNPEKGHFSFDLATLAVNLRKKLGASNYQVPAADFAIESEQNGTAVRLQLSTLNGVMSPTPQATTSISFVLIGAKQAAPATKLP